MAEGRPKKLTRVQARARSFFKMLLADFNGLGLPNMFLTMLFDGWVEVLGEASPEERAPATLGASVAIGLAAAELAFVADGQTAADRARRQLTARAFADAIDIAAFGEVDGGYGEWRARLFREAPVVEGEPTKDDVELRDEVAALSEEERLAKSEYSLTGHTLRDLAPLASLPNLAKLEIESSRLLTDLAPLRSLGALRSLSLSLCAALADLSPLAAVHTLEELVLVKTNVRDISCLGGLPALAKLTVDEDAAASAATLASLPSLRVLTIHGNSLRELTALVRLPRLEELSITLAKGEAVPALPTSLRKLKIDGGDLGDGNILRPLSSLDELALTDTLLGDVSAVGALGRLRKLKTHDVAAFRDCAFVSGLPRLEELSIIGTLSSFDGIGAARALRDVSAFNGTYADLGPLASLPALERFVASDTPTSDLGPLRGAQNLRMLFLNDTRVSDLSPLADLPSLESLDVARTMVRDLAPLARASKLRSLSAEQCDDLASVEPLRGLPALEDVDISECPKLTDLTPLADCPTLRDLWCRDNPQVRGPDTMEALAALRRVRTN